MPGFDILQQPFQFHAPVAPEVPVADNTAAKIISAGTDTAVNGFIKMAVARRQADLEEKQQIQSAALTLRAQDIAEQNNKLDYEVGMANAKSLEEYRKSAGGGGITDPKWRAQQAFLWNQQQKELEAQRGHSVAELENTAMSDPAYKYMNEEKNWVEDPVGTLDKYMNWSGRFGNAVEGRIPKEMTRLKARAELLKIPIRVGATMEPEKYVNPENAAIVPGKGYPKPIYVPPQWKGGDARRVPLVEFVQKWRYHPELRDQMRQELIAAGGNTKIIDRIEKGTPTVTKKTVFSPGIPLIGGRHVPGTTDQVTPGDPGKIVHQVTLNPDVQSTLSKAETGTFLTPPSEVDPELTKPYIRGRNPFGGDEVMPDQTVVDPGAPPAEGMTLPPPDLPPLSPGASGRSPDGIPAGNMNGSSIDYSPTSTDRTLEQARRAYALNPGARDEIMRRLAGMQINPNLLEA